MNENSSLKTSTDTISVGGIAPLTATDYPGKLAAVLFCQGCPLRCPYCQNPHLQFRFLPGKNLNNESEGDREPVRIIPWSEIIAFLNKRQGLLDAVVFSGGEPCLQENLYSTIKEVKDLGFKIGLHTAGIYPKRLDQILPLLDWVGLDIKQIFSKYDFITGTKVNVENIQRSLKLLIDSGIDFECRTTVHSELISIAEINNIANYLKDAGVKKYALQASNKIPDKSDILNQTHDSRIFDSANISKIRRIFPDLEVRGVPIH